MKTLFIQFRRTGLRALRESTACGRILLLVCAAMVLGLQTAGAQNNRERRLILNDYVSPEELISMSKSLPFDKAVSLFTDFSKKYLNKIIVDPTNNKKEIGVDIENMYWLQAFETVLRANSLWYEEKEEYFQIIYPGDSTKAMAGGGGGASTGAMARDSSSKAMFLARDIKISTVFFSIDVSKTLNTGVNWTFKDSTNNGSVYGGQLKSNLENPDQQAATSGSSGSSGGSSGQTTVPDAFIARIIPKLNFGTLTGFVSFLEGNGLGDVISNPQIIVSSGKVGQIQIGTDIFVTTKDFAGNTIQQQIATGLIVKVTPTLYELHGVRFINLAAHVENSKQDGANIDKSSIDTYLLLNDGEETVLGGLYSTTETETRAGVPFLRDLPWYVFGLRYIFGSDIKADSKTELIILLKAEVIPSIEERLADKLKNNENLIEKTEKQMEENNAKHKSKMKTE
ncbi:MAG TPA: type II and III secretion system protein [Bacteroidota bacterium]|nr:type II and III secretion system protein [Bacteroidota bacterium]